MHETKINNPTPYTLHPTPYTLKNTLHPNLGVVFQVVVQQIATANQQIV